MAAHDTSRTPRNAGLDLDLAWVDRVQFDEAALTREAEAYAGRREMTAGDEAAWLCRAIRWIDLTTLSGDDTAERVTALCATALAPAPADLLSRLGQEGLSVASVCVYHAMIGAARTALEGSGLPVAAVAAGFPAGLSSFRARVAEIEDSVSAGAEEIDVVIARHKALEGDWTALYDEIRAFRAACGDAHLKVILSTGELRDLTTVGRTALVAMMAGADFVKTSTGKEKVNATLPAGLAMLRMIRDYEARTGWRVGLKPAGGISTAEAALDWIEMVGAEMGEAWLNPDLFRFGASSLSGDIVERLDNLAGNGAA